jgi:hypothetical protein
LLVGFLLVASLAAPLSGSARAAVADCKAPSPQARVFGCLWTGPNYTGAMSVFDASGRNAGAGCREGSPRSAVNNAPDDGNGPYVFSFYHHTRCEKGGKAFGVLGPQQWDPDLPNVQSYTWTRYRG